MILTCHNFDRFYSFWRSLILSLFLLLSFQTQYWLLPIYPFDDCVKFLDMKYEYHFGYGVVSEIWITMCFDHEYEK